ncbi:hypothetical protein KFK09_004307 [Dendrobium nobile]|uniref:Uncharacterized protein n=1 Tax=Dendrobium nobile TaxID=94219 RepID=A0A8T3C5E1_DENNO|nr:hypothetical protein KFK09_004307 [Dendrobium nobile]
MPRAETSVLNKTSSSPKEEACPLRSIAAAARSTRMKPAICFVSLLCPSKIADKRPIDLNRSIKFLFRNLDSNWSKS